MKLIGRMERLMLKALLARNGLEHRQVAAAMKLHPSAFSGMLNGSRLANENFAEQVRAAVLTLMEAKQ